MAQRVPGVFHVHGDRLACQGRQVPGHRFEGVELGLASPDQDRREVGARMTGMTSYRSFSVFS